MPLNVITHRKIHENRRAKHPITDIAAAYDIPLYAVETALSMPVNLRNYTRPCATDDRFSVSPGGVVTNIETGNEIAPWMCKRGDRMVQVVGIRTTPAASWSRLRVVVAGAYLPPAPLDFGMVVCLDGDETNAFYLNLAWANKSGVFWHHLQNGVERSLRHQIALAGIKAVAKATGHPEGYLRKLQRNKEVDHV